MYISQSLGNYRNHSHITLSKTPPFTEHMGTAIITIHFKTATHTNTNRACTQSQVCEFALPEIAPTVFQGVS